ncbi:MAG: hypothetical protein ACXVP4_04840 [Bacteroidia bacterium]
MKKQAALFLYLILINSLSFAQIGSITTANEPVPESVSNTEIGIYNPNFTNSFVFMMSHGLTVFNQTHDIMLIDSKTFAEKKKISRPTYNGYSDFVINRPVYAHSYFSSPVTTSKIELDKNLALIYKSKDKKGYAVSVATIDESLTASDKPKYLFSTYTKCDGDFGAKGVMVSTNEKKDLCVFEYEGVNPKTKELTYFYRVYNNNLQLIKADSLISNAQQSHVTTAGTRDYLLAKSLAYSAFVYDNGYTIVGRQEEKTVFTTTDIKINKTYTFDIANKNNFLTVEKVQSIANDKLVFFGKYFIVKDNKRTKGGVFKIVFNTKNNNVEDQLYYDGLPTASDENEYFFQVDKTIITQTGACYALISQTIGGQEGSWTKTEVICLNTDADKWKKQVPIPGLGGASMFLMDKNLIISYDEFKGDNTKIDYNNYAYAGNYKGRDTKNYNLALIKINTKTGNIEEQSFPDNDYSTKMDYNNEVIGISQGTNGLVYAKCIFFKIKFDQ